MRDSIVPPAVTVPAKHFIGNAWVVPASGETLPMIDPSDGLPFAAIAAGTGPDVDLAVMIYRHMMPVKAPLLRYPFEPDPISVQSHNVSCITHSCTSVK